MAHEPFAFDAWNIAVVNDSGQLVAQVSHAAGAALSSGVDALNVVFAGVSTPEYVASSDGSKNLPPMGLRFRLKASFAVSKLHGQSKIIATAMQKYGMMMADNGSNWYFQGEGTGNNKKTCWNDNDLDQLKSIPGSDFEVVQTGPIIK